MKQGWHISRRTALKGLGVSVALPWLDAMLPTRSLLRAAEGSAGVAPPRRMAFLYVPNGIHMPAWTPSQEGTDFELPETLNVLEPYRQDLLVLSGLTLDKARANGDGGGDHARSLSAFLTCCQARKTHGADLRSGVSVDQVAARALAGDTKFASLEIGCDMGPQSGNCDSGYSCAYSANISWRTESSPVAKEINPRLVFERLFLDGHQSEGDRERVRRERYRQSILDLVRDDAARLQTKLGTNDQRKLDEYLTSVREVEQRIERATRPGRKVAVPDYPVPAGIPSDYAEHLRLMADMLVLAFQTDVTRISTFVFANEGSNRSYAFIGVPDGHHDLSHHGNDSAKQAKIQKINAFHVQHLAYLLKKLKETKEGDGSLLDQCLVVYGSGLSDGNRHNHDDLPILLCGGGGGTVQPGRHLRYERETPLANLWLSLLDRMGVPTEKLGDSTGRLDRLDS